MNGVNFSNFTVQGKAVTSRTDADASWNINSYVTNITFNTNPTTAISPDRPVQDALPYSISRASSSMTIDLPEQERQALRLQIFNTNGTLESEYEMGPQATGRYTISLRSTSTGRMLSPGLYLCRLNSREFTKAFHFALMR